MWDYYDSTISTWFPLKYCGDFSWLRGSWIAVSSSVNLTIVDPVAEWLFRLRSTIAQLNLDLLGMRGTYAKWCKRKRDSSVQSLYSCGEVNFRQKRRSNEPSAFCLQRTVNRAFRDHLRGPVIKICSNLIHYCPSVVLNRSFVSVIWRPQITRSGWKSTKALTLDHLTNAAVSLIVTPRLWEPPIISR